MLRAWVVVLVLANVGYFAWSRGALAVFGTVPSRFSETEPQRLQRQILPEALEIRKAPVTPLPPIQTAH